MRGCFVCVAGVERGKVVLLACVHRRVVGGGVGGMTRVCYCPRCR